MAERAESQQRIRDLEEENKVLRQAEKEGNVEIERQESSAGFNAAGFIYSRDEISPPPPTPYRLKERQKKTSSQMKHDEEKKKTLQVTAAVTEQAVCATKSPPKVSPSVCRRRLRPPCRRHGACRSGWRSASTWPRVCAGK